jgi:hypothetical protein
MLLSHHPPGLQAEGVIMKRPSTAGLVMSVALVLVAVMATGCASIVKGSEQKVSFKSEPSEAKVVITDVREGKEIQVGSTPFTASLKRGAATSRRPSTW